MQVLKFGLPVLLLLVAVSLPVAAQDLSIRQQKMELGPEFWSRTAPSYGWSRDAVDLKPVHDTRTDRTRHVTFQQEFVGLPVVDRYVRVSTNAANEVTFVMSDYRPAKGSESFDTRPSVPSLAAKATAQRAAGGNADTRTREPVLSVQINDAPKLVWETIVWPLEGGEWRVLVDAETGEVISAVDQSLRHRSPRKATDGQGTVFDPDPLYSSGASYGGAYADADDATNATLDAELRTVVLRDLSVNSQNQYVLTGPYVRIVGSTLGGTSNYTPPAEFSPDGFQYDRSDPGFEAVMAYYHIDKSQRYVQSLGFTDRQDTGLNVHPRAPIGDASKYNPSGNSIEFGTGGVDDAEDATVIWHEYGHALLEAATPGLSVSQEGRAMHEGWSDYWAMSYVRSLVDAGQLPRTDWRQVFAWDSGDGTIWNGRYIEFVGTYPQDTFCDGPQPTSQCNVYRDGLLIATTLMEVYDVLGKTITDQLALHAHAYLGRSATMRDLGEAIVQADRDFFDGNHATALVEVLAARGLVDPTGFGPVVNHDPLSGTDDLGGDAEVHVEARGIIAPVSSVVLKGESTSLGSFSVELQPAGGDAYSGSFTLPTVEELVRYYIEVEDAQGNSTLLPAGAPAEQYAFQVGSDFTAPVITHHPIAVTSMATWPPAVMANVTDNFAVERVEVVYEIESPSGGLLASGTFALSLSSDETYINRFPETFSVLQKDAVVRYRVEAFDTADSPNSSSAPDSGMYSFSISADGLLRAIPANDATITVSGSFSSPSYPAAVPAGGAVMQVGTAHSEAAEHALELPSIDLVGVDTAWFTFWYRIDTPASGTDRFTEGGQVQLRLGDTGTWSTVTPAGGYPGVISQDGGNPLRGMSAYGGDSHGWRFGKVALPVGERVSVRFLYGSDTNAADNGDGWTLTDFRIRTDVPGDQALPSVREVVWNPVLRISGDSFPSFMLLISTSDDQGVTDAFLDFQWNEETVVTAPLDQDDLDLGMYRGVLERSIAPSPGDVIRFRVRVMDASGQEAIAPESGPWYEALYVLSKEQDLLASARSVSEWTDGRIDRADVTGEVASLHLAPFALPANPESSVLALAHSYFLPGGTGATVQVSSDDGRTWDVLSPDSGYPGPMNVDDTHPYSGIAGFQGSSNTVVSLFDVSEWAGQRVWIRLLFATETENGGGGYWDVQSVSLRDDTRDNAFDVPVSFALDTLYPNPFRSRATISFSTETEGQVVLDVSDALGRRVARLVDEVLPAGNHAATLDGTSLAAGVYLVRLQSGGKTTTRTIVRQ